LATITDADLSRLLVVCRLCTDLPTCCCRIRRSPPCTTSPYGIPLRSVSHLAGYPAGLRFPHQVNCTSIAWASTITLLDHRTRLGRVRSRRARVGSRSIRLGNCASILAASGWNPVETMSDPGG
jgi:hypothetical protein